MTKGKNRSIARRKLRRATKNTKIDIGCRITQRHIIHGYGSVAGTHEFKTQKDSDYYWDPIKGNWEK